MSYIHEHTLVMGKKILKIVGFITLLIIVAVVAAPFILESKVDDILRKNVNENINGSFDFSDASLSIIKSFPNAEVSIENVVLINAAPFEGDTLFAANNIAMKIPLGELFKDEGESIAVTNVTLEGAKIHVKVNEDEIANYEIGKESADDATAEDSEGFTLNLQSYEISNSQVIYDDKAAAIHLVVSEIQHKGTGDLSAATSELNTNTEALVSFELDSTNYLNQNKIKLDALIGIDLKEDKYTFLKNEAIVNQLPLVFDGFVKVNEASQDIDIHFKTPSSDFKNFLAVIPEAYSKNIENVQTTGNFVVEGHFKGRSDEEHIPPFNIKINSDNASFKYPDLPKTVSSVQIDTKIINTTGVTEDTYVTIDKLSFKIDQDHFNMVAKIKELLGNTKVNAHIDGKMNLANIEKAYPVPADLDLKGIVDADITTTFDMDSIEKEQYENTQTSGQLRMTDFEYASEETPNPVKIESTSLTFNPKTVKLNEIKGATGKTDFNAKGTINNLLGFLFNDEKVRGNFNLKSDVFALNDFMVEEETEAATENQEAEEQIKIPSFLDANFNVAANTVIYDNITLKDVKGNLKIKDEKATLSNMTSSMFNGKLGFEGEVSTKSAVPSFAMKLGLDQLRIGEAFKALELFETLAPAAKILRGKFNSDIMLSGNLTDDFTPDLTNLSGKVVAEMLAVDLDDKKEKVLSALGEKLEFLDIKRLDLKGLKTALNFEDGVVQVKPFSINYEDIEIKVDGSHTFDHQLNYKATMNVPAKYLGREVNSLIAKIDEGSLHDLTIPVIANISGSYGSPEVSTDFTTGVKNLTKKLVDIQKQKLIDQGKDKAKDLLGDVLGTNNEKADSTAQNNPSKEAVKDVLGGIIGGSKKDTVGISKDSVPTKDTIPTKVEDVVEEKAKDILGGLFGRKKKKDSVQKDTVN